MISLQLSIALYFASHTGGMAVHIAPEPTIPPEYISQAIQKISVSVEYSAASVELERIAVAGCDCNVPADITIPRETPIAVSVDPAHPP